MRRIQSSLIVTTALVLFSSCGGSDAGSEQVVSIAELSVADQAVLSGDWPLQARTSSFVVRDELEWKAIWQTRKSSLSERCNLPYNQAACAADQPPIIDFAKYSLVGVLLSPTDYFQSPNPKRVAVDATSNKLIVEYQYSSLIRAPFYLVTGTRFFLVPKTNAALDARPSEA